MPRLADWLTPEQRIEKRIVLLERNQRLLRKWEIDQTKRLNQVRRSMGFNGKVDDPEIESDLAAGFHELRLLAKSRRETETVERAKEIVRAHYARHLPNWLTWSARQSRRKLLWFGTALGSAIILGLGSRLGDSLLQVFRGHHWFGF